MKDFKDYLGFLGVVIVFVFFVSVFRQGLIHLFDGPVVEQNSSLFYPQSGDLQIKVTNKYQNNGKFICEEQTLNNIVYAQLRLYPTIGCERPTLFYLEEGSSEIKKIVVSDAYLLK